MNNGCVHAAGVGVDGRLVEVYWRKEMYDSNCICHGMGIC